MRAKAVLLVLALIAVVAVGCVAPSMVPGATMTENGTLMFSADGMSVVAREGDPLSIAEAREAASLLAQANLLKKIKGQYVTDTVKVGDLMFESQEATSVVEGFMARVTVVFAPGPERGPQPAIVNATASLELTPMQFQMLKDYIE